MVDAGRRPFQYRNHVTGITDEILYEYISAQIDGAVQLKQHMTIKPSCYSRDHVPAIALIEQVANLLKAKQNYKEVTGKDYAPPPQEKKPKPTPKVNCGSRYINIYTLLVHCNTPVRTVYSLLRISAPLLRTQLFSTVVRTRTSFVFRSGSDTRSGLI